MTSPETKTIRQIMDPEGTLPVVDLVPDPDVRHPSNVAPSRMAIMHEGQRIGKMNMERNPAEPDGHQVWLNGVEITGMQDGESMHGKGFGMASYLAAIEAAHAKGDTFRTHDVTTTEAAAKVWAKFIDNGIAEVVEPFRQVSVTTTTGKVVEGLYTGHAQILPFAATKLHAEPGLGAETVGVGRGEL